MSDNIRKVPTAKLKLVQKRINGVMVGVPRILQWWEPDEVEKIIGNAHGEWRDLPIEVEKIEV